MSVLARLAGMGLGGFFGALARVRRTRALHPVGVVGVGVLSVVEGPSHGVPLLAGSGSYECLVRWSRATGFERIPDVEGVALRVEGPSGGDVLFASTGSGVVGRHVLALRPPGRPGTVTTFMPLETAGARLLFRLEPERGSRGSEAGPPTAYRFFVAAPGCPWHERGRLDVAWEPGDSTRRHDPVGRPLEGTWFSPGWEEVRASAYRTSQEVPARLDTSGPNGSSPKGILRQ